MSIFPEEELAKLDVAPEEAVQAAVNHDESESGVSEIRQSVRSRANVSRRMLRGARYLVSNLFR